MPTARTFITGCVVDSKIYVFDGANDNIVTRLISALEIYDPSTDTWTKGADKPTPVIISGSCTINGMIYVMGGTNQVDYMYPIVEIYDTKNDKWIEGKDMPLGRISATNYPVIDGKIYVIGGVGPNVSFLSDVWEFTPEDLQSVVSAQGKLPKTWGNIKSK